MTSKVIIIIALCLTAAHAEGPYLGLKMPKLGLNLPSFSSRIVGGSEAVRGAFPHQVTLQWGIPPLLGLSHFCGGSLISNQWVLTAGHCVLAVPSYGSFVVKAGKHEIKVTESTEQSATVLASYVHENYTGGVAPFDIALLKLSKSLILSKTVAPVNLPKPNLLPVGNTILSGWGSISLNSTTVLPPTLQTAVLPVINLSTCKTAIEKLTGSAPLHQTNVCTGPLTGGYSACSGDSGGPLITRNSTGYTEISGIVSWGIIPCGTKGAPSVYTRVSAFVDWIQRTIAKNS